MGAEILNWSIALAPVVLLIVLFEWLDVFHLMHVRTIALLLLIGALSGLSAYPVSGRLLDALPMGFSTYSRFVAPWIEEALKAAGIMWLFATNRIGFKIDAAISGFAIGAGFSVVENAIYLTRFPDLDFGVWLVRGFGTAVMHGGTAALLASVAHQFNERDMRQRGTRPKWHPLHFLPGYVLAVAVHTGFNMLPNQPLLAMVGSMTLVPLVLLLVFRFGEGEARRWLDEEIVCHRTALEELRSGAFPQTASGQLVQRLADRLDGRASPDLVREYLLVHTELVLRAEEMLRQREDGVASGPTETDRALLQRLGTVRQQLGRTTFATLKPLLPFSPSDFWEMRQLSATTRRH